MWLQMVGTDREAMLFKFVSATYILSGVHGSGYDVPGVEACNIFWSFKFLNSGPYDFVTQLLGIKERKPHALGFSLFLWVPRYTSARHDPVELLDWAGPAENLLKRCRGRVRKRTKMVCLRI